MGVKRLVLAGIVLVLATAATALAGTVTASSDKITYTTNDSAGDNVEIGIENGQAFVYSALGVTGAGCTQTDPNRIDCPPTQAFVVNLAGFDDRVDAQKVPAGVRTELHGDSGSDTLVGGQGNDILDGGPGDDYLFDGPGDDSVSGGPNQDGFTPGPGRDTMSGGDGNSDYIDYGGRSAGVTITANGVADDGEAGEGDNVGTDIESLYGGSGNDRIAGGPDANTLRGGAGNDSITASAGEQRVEGNEGDDTIDTRDGGFDSVDCGPGTDTLLGDPNDTGANCEVAPDRDGDGTLNEADCAPDNAAVHPGAGEVFGNTVDEDCKDGPGYFKVVAGFGIKVAPRRSPASVRFTSLQVSGLRGGDRIEIRCTGRTCPFKRATRTVAAGRQSVSLTAIFKRRYLRAGTIVEMRVLRTLHVGRVIRLRVTRNAGITRSLSCLLVGATKPGVCPEQG